MNRTEEYLRHIDKDTQKSSPHIKESFYDSINTRTIEIDTRLKKSLSYKELLKIEEQFSHLMVETQQTLDSIVMGGPNDLILHFEGIKRIIQLKLQRTEKNINRLKDSKVGMSVDLEPEKPQSFKQVHELSVMEEENKRLVEEYNLEGYRLTRRRLLEVEAIQDTIFQHLTLQDERIDDIVDLTSRAGACVSGSNETLGKMSESTKFLRRFLFILLLCLSFILLFLHYYYK